GPGLRCSFCRFEVFLSVTGIGWVESTDGHVSHALDRLHETSCGRVDVYRIKSVLRSVDSGSGVVSSMHRKNQFRLASGYRWTHADRRVDRKPDPNLRYRKHQWTPSEKQAP